MNPALFAVGGILALTGFILLLFMPLQMGVVGALLTIGHSAIGILATMGAAIWCRKRMGSLWVKSPSAVAGSLICAISGLVMVVVCLSGNPITRAPFALQVHILAGIGLVLILAKAVMTGTSRLIRMRSRRAVLAGLAILPGAGLIAITGGSEAYYRRISSTNPHQAGNPMFPSGVDTTSRWETDDVENAASCGKTGCHPDALKHWEGSAHAMAASSSVYKQSLTKVIESRGNAGARWCKGCHEPSSLFAASVGSNRGVDCLACHSVRTVPSSEGNGACQIEPLPIYDALGKGETRNQLESHLVNLRPDPHRAATSAPRELKEISCARCHRSAASLAQNHYGWVRLDNTWGEWQESSYSGQSVSHLGLQPKAKGCLACHQQGSDSHAMEPKKSNGSFIALHAFVVAPMDGTDEDFTLDIVIENTGVGHHWPSFGSSVELRLTHSSTGVLASHRIGGAWIDRSGNLISNQNKQSTVALLGDAPVGIAAGDAALARFTVERSLREAASEFQVALTSGGSEGVVILSSLTINIPRMLVRGPFAASLGSTSRQEPASIWIAYGKALMSFKEWPRARKAFDLARMAGAPESVVNWRLGQAFLAEGDLLSARAALERAQVGEQVRDAVQLGLAQAARLMGQFDEAMSLLSGLSNRYPRDKSVWFQLGRSQFQAGRFHDAELSFKKAIGVDPEDTALRFNLMQAYSAQRKVTASRTEEAIYRLQASETGAADALESAAMRHRDLVRERQAIHTHRLTLKPTR